jgi:hypothetical protein
MSTEDIAAQPVQPPPEPATPTASAKSRPRWLRRAGIAVALIVALIAGAAIGAAGNSHSAQITQLQGSVRTYQHSLSVANGKVSADQNQITTLQGNLSTAQNQAAHALAIATTKAKNAYAARMAAANAAYATASGEQRTLNQLIGNVQASAISQDGVYVVGHDVKAGTWHTNGDNGVGGDACYFATLNSDNTQDIADNNNFDGAETVVLNGVYAFQISGPCQWVRIGS